MNGLPTHLLRGERRAFERNEFGIVKTVFIRRLDYMLMVLGLGLCILVVIGLSGL